MEKEIVYTDGDGNEYSVICSGDIMIKEIDPDDEWILTTIDINNVTETTDWVGPRPKK